jgi:hypothetical protein
MCTFSSVDIATGSPPVFRSDPIIDHPRSSKGSGKTCFDMSRYGENMEKMFKTFSALRTEQTVTRIYGVKIILSIR